MISGGAPKATRRLRSVKRALIGATALGCTSVLGIDGEYDFDDGAEAGSGGRPSSGDSSTGGRAGGTAGTSASGGFPGAGASAGTATGGTAGQGATGNAGATGGGVGGCAGNCTQGTKCCDDICVVPSIENGCSTAGCDPCPDPIANAEAFCDDALSVCSARCRPGFVLGPGGCVEGGTGGSGGSPPVDAGPVGGGGVGGSGGAAPLACTGASTCPPCTNPVEGPLPCCDLITRTCGCTWFPAYCLQ